MISRSMINLTLLLVTHTSINWMKLTLLVDKGIILLMKIHLTIVLDLNGICLVLVSHIWIKT